MAFTAPWVPTGMNTCVSTVPWAVAMIPRRARPSVWVTRKENSGAVIWRYSLQSDLEAQRTTKLETRRTTKGKHTQRTTKGTKDPQRKEHSRHTKHRTMVIHRSLSFVSFAYVVSFVLG